jgi:endonuclease-3
MPKPPKKPRKRAALKPAEQARIAEIFARFEADESDPRTELNYDSPFTLVVAVALSAQATDVSVNKATAKLFEAADTPEQMLALGEAGLKPFISSIGLYNTKAKNVIALSRILIEQYGGEVPLEREKLQALPGVGRKTASVVLNELRIEPAIAVDTHVFRVSHRLGLSTGKTPDAVEADLMAIVPDPLKTRAHHWLILHGRYVCVARRPKCEECVVGDLCPSRHLFVGRFSLPSRGGAGRVSGRGEEVTPGQERRPNAAPSRDFPPRSPSASLPLPI